MKNLKKEKKSKKITTNNKYKINNRTINKLIKFKINNKNQNKNRYNQKEKL